MHILIIAILFFISGILFQRYVLKTPQAALLTSKIADYEANISATTFDKMVLQTSNDTPVLVDFYAAWCAPCKDLAPLLSEMAENYQGNFLLAKVDVDKENSLAETYNVRSMPTVMLFKGGKKVGQFEGNRAKHSIKFFLAEHGIKQPEVTANASS